MSKTFFSSIVAVGVAVWTSLSGAAPLASVASPSSGVEEPSEQVSESNAVGNAARAIANLEAHGDLPLLDRTDSLTGIDADANGIRDDLDRFIDRTFGDATQREAAVKLTKTIQQTLLVDAGNHVAVMTLARRHAHDLSCFSGRFKGDRATGSELRRQLHSLTTNTKERLLAYLRFDRALNGQAFRLPQGDGCE